MGTRNAHEREVWQKNKRGETLSWDEEIILEGIKYRREEERFDKKMRKGILAEWRARREADLARSSANTTPPPLPVSMPPPQPPVFPPFPAKPFEGSKVSDQKLVSAPGGQLVFTDGRAIYVSDDEWNALIDEQDAFIGASPAEWDAFIQLASGQALTPEAKAADQELTRETGPSGR